MAQLSLKKEKKHRDEEVEAMTKTKKSRGVREKEGSHGMAEGLRC